MRTCSFSDQLLSDPAARSSCDNNGPAHQCWSMIPWTVNSTLAYGYAATSSGDVCGKCYRIQFTGQSFNAPGDPGSAALLGKTMIVQAINIGFDACSAQWGVSNSELGAQYGGLLAACKQELGWNAPLSSYKTCLTNKCNSVFGSRGLTTLQQGCRWYADWFEAADNPSLKYTEVACPAELTSKSGMQR
jgi:hypothetical protein